MKRSERQTLARQTVAIVEQGTYQSPSGRTVSIRSEVNAAKTGTRLYSATDLSAPAALPLRARPATVITAPAPNAGAVIRNEPALIPEIEPTLRRRAELVLQVAALHNIENLILGAWGCGVFRNDPNTVASAFADLLKPGRPYSRFFDRVVFAVFDPAREGPNYQAFEEVFSP